jgi:titin
VVAGNYVGTDASGTAAVPNDLEGVVIAFDASNNTVGGTAAGARNVIAGNAFGGVTLAFPGAAGNVVAGNYVGTDASGTAALGNIRDGVLIRDGAANNTVGGTAAGARNVIAGNTGAGVNITGTGTTGNVVAGNYIGTNASGTAAVPNAFNGVLLSAQASNNTVGGTAAEARNVISGNAREGVLIFTSATGTVVAGNSIGVAADGTTPLGNARHGVFVTDAGFGNTVGGTAAGSGNVIAFNGGAGVLVGSDPADNFSYPAGPGNAVEGDSIHDNGALGIDLGPADGVTANDPGDADTGPNDLQNYPVITAVAAGASGGTDVTLTLDSAPSTAFRVELFANDAPDPSGFGEGQTYLGFADVSTDAGGHFAGTVSVAGTVAAGQTVTATATDPAGNTSEFSADFPPPR